MRTISLLFTMTAVVALPVAMAQGWYAENFESLTVGQPVAGWSGGTVAYDNANHSNTGNKVFEAGTDTYLYQAESYSDCTIRAQCKWFDANWGSYGGIVFRYADSENFCRAWFRDGIQVKVTAGGSPTAYYTGASEPNEIDPNAYVTNTYYWMKVVASGRHIQVYTSFDGTTWDKQINVVDDYMAVSGSVGLAAMEHTHFDEIAVGPAQLELQCDDPGTVYLPTDLSGPEGVPDCYVNLYDIAILSSSWLTDTEPQ